jgi:hypothetical protein
VAKKKVKRRTWEGRGRKEENESKRRETKIGRRRR